MSSDRSRYFYLALLVLASGLVLIMLGYSADICDREKAENVDKYGNLKGWMVNYRETFKSTLFSSVHKKEECLRSAASSWSPNPQNEKR